MKNYKTYFENTVLNSVDLEPYNIEVENDFDKIQEVYKIFKKEYIHNYNRFKNEAILFSEWLQGLPTVLTVPFYYHEQLKQGKEAGYDLSTEEKEDLFTSMYFTRCSDAFFTLKNNL